MSADDPIVISSDEETDPPQLTLRDRVEKLEAAIGCPPYVSDYGTAERIRYLEDRLGVDSVAESNFPSRINVMEAMIKEEGMLVPFGINADCRSWYIGFVNWHRGESIDSNNLSKKKASSAEELMYLNFLAFYYNNFGNHNLSTNSEYMGKLFACRPNSYEEGAFGKWQEETQRK